MESTGYMIKMARPRPKAADNKCLRDALMVLTNAVNGLTISATFGLVVVAAAPPAHCNAGMDNADADADMGGTGRGNRLESAVAAALEQQATKNSSHAAARPIMVLVGLFRRTRPTLWSVVLLNDVRDAFIK